MADGQKTIFDARTRILYENDPLIGFVNFPLLRTEVAVERHREMIRSFSAPENPISVSCS
jgi:hypothetical protein